MNLALEIAGGLLIYKVVSLVLALGFVGILKFYYAISDRKLWWLVWGALAVLFLAITHKPGDPGGVKAILRLPQPVAQQQQQQQEADEAVKQRFRATAISLPELSIRRVSFSAALGMPGSAFDVQGEVTNSSRFKLGEIDFEFSALDCPSTLNGLEAQPSDCVIVARDQRTSRPINSDPGETRPFYVVSNFGVIPNANQGYTRRLNYRIVGVRAHVD